MNNLYLSITASVLAISTTRLEAARAAAPVQVGIIAAQEGTVTPTIPEVDTGVEEDTRVAAESGAVEVEAVVEAAAEAAEGVVVVEGVEAAVVVVEGVEDANETYRLSMSL